MPDEMRATVHLTQQDRYRFAVEMERPEWTVAVTPACPYCPRAALLAHGMPMASPRVRADVVEATEFPALADRYGVFGVPKVVINESQSFEGALPEAAFLAHVLAAANGTTVPTPSGGVP